MNIEYPSLKSIAGCTPDDYRDLREKKLMKKIYSILILLILFVGNLSAQKNSDKTVTKDGKKFYLHIVSKGETIYGISKDYNKRPGKK